MFFKHKINNTYNTVWGFASKIIYCDISIEFLLCFKLYLSKKALTITFLCIGALLNSSAHDNLLL